ncbi:DUF4190 domain-containing protein [Microbispora sp. ATCC PTA-5024]|uniref:DUF4190 domain-containing protein n=1 Tax=Microbispora sp. ATCC PTA-5024 TaxID=316330 RepID=UPI0003DC08F5|nr:DUF4190 domain-containing protein [Microbispora sp. ATCC PTA-5024]ETK30815.1 hypothetical protein MPTA5024_38310 [Microbispora sp. ATCC PTA-5024]
MTPDASPPPPGPYGAPHPGAGPYGDPSAPPNPYAAPPAGPYAGPPADPYGAPTAGPYAGAYPGPPAGPYGTPPAGPYAAPPAGPYGTPPAGPYAGPPADPYGAPYGMPYPPYGQVPPRPRMNGFAVTSLVFGIIGGVLLSVVFGVIALRQIRRRGERGRGLAVAGLVLSGVWVALIVAVALVAVLTSAQLDANGTITGGGSVASTALRPGDCVNGVADGVVVTSVTGVPCTQAHDAEVITQFDLPVKAWPGREAAGNQASEQCEKRLNRMLADSPMLDRLRSFVLYPPSQSAWARSRSVTCMVVEGHGGKLNGPVPR